MANYTTSTGIDSTKESDFWLENRMCEELHIAPRTAQRWRKNGQGPPWTRLGPRRIAYNVGLAKKYIAERTFTHRAEELAKALAVKP